MLLKVEVLTEFQYNDNLIKEKSIQISVVTCYILQHFNQI